MPRGLSPLVNEVWEELLQQSSLLEEESSLISANKPALLIFCKALETLSAIYETIKPIAKTYAIYPVNELSSLKHWLGALENPIVIYTNSNNNVANEIESSCQQKGILALPYEQILPLMRAQKPRPTTLHRIVLLEYLLRSKQK